MDVISCAQWASMDQLIFHSPANGGHNKNLEVDPVSSDIATSKDLRKLEKQTTLFSPSLLFP